MDSFGGTISMFFLFHKYDLFTIIESPDIIITITNLELKSEKKILLDTTNSKQHLTCFEFVVSITNFFFWL